MRSERGFTLVEIMIVLAIIAIGTTLAFANLQRWNRHNRFVGFQREVFSELQEARTRAVSMGRQYILDIDIDTGTATLLQGDAAGAASNDFTPARATVAAPFDASITDVRYTLGATTATASGSHFFLLFNPAGDVYRRSSAAPGGVVTELDDAAVHLSSGAGETATIQLFCWTGKARLSNGTI